MPTRNPYIARFDAVPSLVSSTMQGVFEASLHQAALVQARLDADTTAPKMTDDFWFSDDDWRARLRPYVVKDGVLQIPVKGVLLHDFPYQFFGWATGYAYIWRAFERGMNDPAVKGIALVCDSPGGEVAGNFDLVDKMFAMRGTKPIRGYAAESAYSAAYSIISVADKITVSRTGGVGSIGVVTAHVDLSKMMEDFGYKITFIHFGKHKVDGNPYQPLPEEVKDRIQARINELGEVFVSTVARNRAKDEQVIRDTEALTFTASQAVANGLADAIGSFDDEVTSFARELSEEGEEMADFTQAQYDEGVATARTEGENTGKDAGRKEGATTERERINAIIDSEEGKKRPKAALSVALDTDMTVEQAAKFLSKQAEEKPAAQGNNFVQAMNTTDNPDLAAAGEGDGGEKLTRAERAFILAGKPARQKKNAA